MFFIKRKKALRKLKKEQAKIELNEEVWTKEKDYIQRQNTIDEEKKELSIKRREIKFPAWSKVLSLLLFLNFTGLEIFIGYITLKSFALAEMTGMSPDLTPLMTLISAVIGEILSYFIYILKSKAENTRDGVVFETAMYNLAHPQQEEEGENNGY